MDVAIVGAGVCGLTAARILQDAGLRVCLVDKASRPGGRLSSRNLGGVEVNTGPPSFDHLGPGSAREVALAMARGLDIRRGLVTHLEPEALVLYGQQRLSARHIIVTAPVPQSRLLLERSGITCDTHVNYDRVQELIVWGQGRATVLPASPEWSLRHWSDDLTDVESRLLAQAHVDFAIEGSVMKRWRYANALNPNPRSFVNADGVLLAGDGFTTEPDGLQRAARSGRDLAQALLR
jgi:predicted NAD/FAD-dependent oxidoreductase